MTETNPNESDDEPESDSERDVGAEWMEPVDDEILDVMRENHVFAPKHIEEEGVCRGPDAATRCRKLTEYGLLERQAIGMYDLTDLGERYLEGEVDPSELEAEDE